MINIEENIPIPSQEYLGRGEIYPWSRMKIGDSFLVPVKKEHLVRCAAYNICKRTGKKFTIRKTIDGVRVWRIA